MLTYWRRMTPPLASLSRLSVLKSRMVRGRASGGRGIAGKIENDRRNTQSDPTLLHVSHTVCCSIRWLKPSDHPAVTVTFREAWRWRKKKRSVRCCCFCCCLWLPDLHDAASRIHEVQLVVAKIIFEEVCQGRTREDGRQHADVVVV